MRQVDIDKVVVDQKHLTQIQCLDIQNILTKYEKQFDGSLGAHMHKKVHIDLLSGSEPVHHSKYPVSVFINNPLKRNSIIWLILVF